MIVVEPFGIEYDVSFSSIEVSMDKMRGYRLSPGRHFFVVFTREYRAFLRESERHFNQGYDAVFFQAKDDLPSVVAWDIVMYSCSTGEALARIEHRPTP